MIRNCRLSVLAATILLLALSNSVSAKNYYSSGDLVMNKTISAWFDRSIDVYGVRLLVAGDVGGQSKVPDEWAKKTAQTFKLLMDRDAPGIDRDAQKRMIKTLLGESGWHSGRPAGQRIAYGGGSSYSPDPLSDQGRLSYAGLEALQDSMALDDMVWYRNVDSSFNGDDDINEILEHVLHTLHRFGVRGAVEGSTDALNMEVETSDVAQTALYLAMREAYDNGVFDIEGYGGDINKEDAWPVMLKEYQYLLTFGMWNFGAAFWENGSLSPEWNDNSTTPEGIFENNPLGYALFETYFSPVISKPSISALRLIFQDGDQGVSGYQPTSEEEQESEGNSSLEEPINGEIHSGIGNLRGWAISNNGIDRVEIFIDGKYMYDAPYGGLRVDVEAGFPTVDGSLYSGYSLAFGYADLGAGQHTVRAVAYDSLGNSTEQSSTFNVVIYDKNFINSNEVVDLSGSTVSASGDEVMINGASIGQQGYNLKLKWRTAEQGFEVMEIQ